MTRELVARIGGVTVGVIEACLDRTVIEVGEVGLPYRIHETIRELVRRAGAAVQPHWSAKEWREAAEGALAEFECRFQAAVSGADGQAAIRSLALGKC